MNHCRNSSVLSLLSALLALFQCACVSSFSILVQFFSVDFEFSTHDVRQKTDCPFFRKEVKKTKKNVTLETKILVIRKKVADKKLVNIFSSLGLTPPTVSTIMTNAAKIK